jgi:hypothetical protein
MGIIAKYATDLELNPASLSSFLVSGDVSDMSPRMVAEVIAGLHRLYDMHPLSRAFIVVDGKVYATAIAAGQVGRRSGLAVEIVSVDVVDVLGTKQIKVVTECGPADDVAALAAARAAGKDVRPRPAGVEQLATYLPAQVERVTEWGKRNGKSYPEKKEWRDPTPDQAANLLMKAQTKARRRAILARAGMGTAAAEDLPQGLPRDHIIEVDGEGGPEPGPAAPAPRERRDAGLLRAVAWRVELWAALTGLHQDDAIADLYAQIGRQQSPPRAAGTTAHSRLAGQPTETLLSLRALITPRLDEELGPLREELEAGAKNGGPAPAAALANLTRGRPWCDLPAEERERLRGGQ